MIQQNQITELFQEISSAKKILIPISTPDGDAFGSALALKLILEQMGVTVVVISSFGTQGIYKKLPNAEKIINEDLYDHNLLKDQDLIIIPDTASLNQLVDLKKHKDGEFRFPESVKAVNIDHHASNTNFANLTLLDSKASSCGEIIYKLFKDKIKMSHDIALCLLVAISSDTGHFRYVCNSELLKIAAELVEYDIDMRGFIRDYYYTKTPEAMLLTGIALSRLITDKERKYCLTYLTKKDLEQGNANKDDLDQAEDEINDNLIQSVDGTDFGIRLSEDKADYTSGSLRGRTGKVDLNLIAKEIGGGGHHEAAGFHLRCSLESALIRVTETVNNILYPSPLRMLRV